MNCNNMKRDCQWVGTVGTLEKHVGVCQFALVLQTKECKDYSGMLKIMRIFLFLKDDNQWSRKMKNIRGAKHENDLANFNQ